MKPRKEGDGGAPMSLLFQGANLPARNVSVGLLAAGLPEGGHRSAGHRQDRT